MISLSIHSNYMVTPNNIQKGNLSKILKTVRGSIKKAIFYLGANISYDCSSVLITPLSISIDEIKRKYPDLYCLIELDYQIRKTDDILDENLYKKNPLPVTKIREQIRDFRKKDKDFKEVADLFKLELDLHIGKVQNFENKLRRIIEIRPCDYFLLVDSIISKFGSVLSTEDLHNSNLFFKEFQRLRDLFDDIMTTEEDLIKNSYNNVIIAEKNGLSYEVIDSIINNKFIKLSEYVHRIKKHPHKKLLKQTIEFWKKQYLILFKPLLVSYYTNKDDYKKIYFMFKQV